MRWFAPPRGASHELRVAPRLESWNKADDPDQIRLQAYLDDTQELVAGSRQDFDGEWALSLDVGLPASRDLLDAADLDNYIYPLARRIGDADLVSVWCTKRHAEHSRVRMGPAREVTCPWTELLVIKTTASSATKAYKEQINEAVAGLEELPPGPVKLELSFVVGQRRNWMNLWKPTIDALDPLLGRTNPNRPFHPRDGRITELGMHLTVNPVLGNDVEIGVVPSSPVVAVQGGGRPYVFGLRVTCPKCGAGPQTECPTPYGQHHPERLAAFRKSQQVAGQLGFGDPTTEGWPDEILAALYGEWPPTFPWSPDG